jgi:hypothetical protein
MALPTIDRDDFRDVAGDVIAGSSSLLDWSALLQGYEWNGANWRGGLNAHATMHRQLAKAAGPEKLADAVAEIVRWGSLPPLSAEAVERVLSSGWVTTDAGGRLHPSARPDSAWASTTALTDTADDESAYLADRRDGVGARSTALTGSCADLWRPLDGQQTHAGLGSRRSAAAHSLRW